MLAKTMLTVIMFAVIAGMVAVMNIPPAVAQTTTPSASRSFDSASVDPGGQVVVTISASNYGSAGGVIEDLPDSFAYVGSSLSDSQVTELPNNQVRFTLQGDTRFTYTVTASNTPGNYVFDGTLINIDRNEHTVGGATTVTVNAPPAQAAPRASRSFNPASVDPGGQVVVTIAAANYGQAGGVTEDLPTGFSYVSSSLSDSQVTELPNNQVRFTLQGDTRFTYTVTASSTPGSYDFSGALRDENRNDHTVGGDSRVTVNTPPGQTTPSASRSFNPASVDPGGQVVVTIAAANYGRAGGVTETLPTGFSYVDSDLDAAQVTELANNKVRFTLQGDTRFTYTVTASNTPDDYVFDGTLIDEDRNEYTVTGATTATVQGPNATRSFSSSSVRPSARVTVTIAASNYGQAGGVTETLPTGFSYVSSSLDAVQVTELANNKVRFTLQGDTRFTYTVTASSSTGNYDFSGTLRDDRRNDHAVGGTTRITVSTVSSPPSSSGGGGGSSTNRDPRFDEGARASRFISENSPPGTKVRGRVAATDRDGDRLTYSLSGADASFFRIDSSDGQIFVGSGTALDFEARDSYVVTVRARDRSRSDTISITITVTNVDEAGEVALSPEQAEVGTQLTAALSDPDGSVSATRWTWERSADNTAWTTIPGARSSAYTPVKADEGHYLRATVAYTDGHGGNKSAVSALLADLVPATPEPTATPIPEPTATPTPEPTATPTPEPTATPTPEPTATPTPEPTATPTPEPTATPTPEPTATATPEPTATATPEPTATATPEPTAIPEPTPEPTATATPEPTATPIVGPPAGSGEGGGFLVWAIALIVIGGVAVGAIGFYVARMRS